MPLFQENPLRSAVVGTCGPTSRLPGNTLPLLISRLTATAAVAVGHFVTRFLVSPGEYKSISRKFPAMC